MTEQIINTKGLGLKQMAIIYRMIKEHLVIRVIHDYRDNTRVGTLQDFEGDNYYEEVPERITQSLYDRGIFLVHTMSKSIDMDIDEFVINNSAVKYFQ